MEETSQKTNNIKRTTLDYLEQQIDIWNRTATKKKNVITTWRKRVFALVILGTLCGLLSQEFSDYDTPDVVGQYHIDAHEVLALASAIAIALSTFAGAQILTSDLEKEQLKSRSAAEAIKVQAYLYLMSAPPYIGKNKEKVLYRRVEEILKEVADITHYLGNSKKDNFWVQKFDLDMTFDEYIEERVNGQINGYYFKKASEFQTIINRGKSWTLIFGFLAVGVGAFGATSPDGVGASMWIAFLSTVGASIGSYLYSNKYEFLMMSYVSTANQLELMSAKHKSMHTPTYRTQRKFISEVESVFAMEHNSWLSEVSGSPEEEDEYEQIVAQDAFNDLVDKYGGDFTQFLKTQSNETIQSMRKSVDNAVQDVKNTVHDKIEDTTVVASETKKKVDRSIAEAKESVNNKIQESETAFRETKEHVEETISEVKSNVEHEVNNLKAEVSHAKESMVQTIENVQETVQETKEEISNSVRDTKDEIVESLQEALDETSQSIGK